MMKANLILTILVCGIALCIPSCTTDNGFPDEENEEQENVEAPEIPADAGDTDDETLVPNTQATTYPDAVGIAFTGGGSVAVNNPFEGKGVTVTVNREHVVITSVREDVELNYVLSGITADGSVKIYGNYKFGLVLNGTGITNPRGAAINIQCGKKITVTVADGTNNRLIDGSSYALTEGEDMKAAFFSEGQLNMYGKGRLEVRGKYKHAICTDDYFRMYEGDIRVREAASDGIHANDDVLIAGGALSVRSAGDGVESEKDVVQVTGGTVQIVTTGEKGHGVKSAGDATIDSTGDMEITVYGNASKGISTGGNLTLRKGNITVNTAGDAFYDTEDADISSAAGIKCDGDLTVEDGDITILSAGKGGKGISADGRITVNDGRIAITTTGGQYVYNRNYDTAAKAMKCDGDMTINSGDITIRTFGVEAEGLESKATLTIAGGNIEIDAYDDCINAARHIQIDGGHIYCNSAANDGIDSNGTLTVTGGVVLSAGSSQPEEGFDCDRNRFTVTGGTIIGTGGATSTPTAAACTQHVLVYSASATSPEIIHIESATNKDVLTFRLPKTYNRQFVFLFSSPALAGDATYTLHTGGDISGGTDFHGLCTGASYSGGAQAGTFTTASMVSSLGNAGSVGGGGGFPGGW
jgi:hypothetical protein